MVKQRRIQSGRSTEFGRIFLLCLTMKVDRITQWIADDVGYTYVDDDGNYWTRLFMEDMNTDDLWFPVTLGPNSPREPFIF